MKRIFCVVCAAMVLAGCGAQETFETISDDIAEPVMVQMRGIELELPQDAVAAVMDSEETGALYLCNDFTLVIQTMAAGDLDRTVRGISGFGAEDVTMLRTQQQDADRYEWVWSAAGEGGDQLCRGVILDDGSYHYTLSVMADADVAGGLEKEWDGIFSSFRLDQ